MAQYTTKRKYTKKPTATKKVVKKVKKETVESVVEAPVAVEQPTTIKSLWNKVVSWFKK